MRDARLLLIALVGCSSPGHETPVDAAHDAVPPDAASSCTWTATTSVFLGIAPKSGACDIQVSADADGTKLAVTTRNTNWTFHLALPQAELTAGTYSYSIDENTNAYWSPFTMLEVSYTWYLCGTPACTNNWTPAGSFTLDVSDPPYTGHLTFSMVSAPSSWTMMPVKLDVSF